VNSWDAKSWCMVLAVVGGTVCCTIAAVEGNYGAVGAIIAAVASAMVGLHNSQKLDDNTAMTQEGANTAKENNRVAVQTAEVATATSDHITKALNGGIDDSIAKALAPIKAAMAAHAAQDEASMTEVRKALEVLAKPNRPQDEERVGNGR
jgi:hypothetical protein